jgi:hypothetical protein
MLCPCGCAGWPWVDDMFVELGLAVFNMKCVDGYMQFRAKAELKRDCICYAT